MDLGINLWGADWSSNGERMLPTTAQIDYFAAKGFSNIRLPFAWETIQKSLNGPLDADFVSDVRAIVEYAAKQGIDVVLDVHNYGKYNDQLIGSSKVPVSAFTDLWSRIATEFSGNENVRFGLMNEPQQENAGEWLSMVNSAIAAIREVGADQQVLVPGIGWTGAWSWVNGDNANVIGAPGAIVDPAGNYAFEVHQYLDDTSGQHEWVVSETIGVERLKAITEWARANGETLYLGEFGVADNPQALAALEKMMQYLKANSDVWTAASYWVAGTANPNYIYTVQPKLGIFDAPQMDVLEKFAADSVTTKVLADGTVRQDVYGSGGKVVTLSDILTKDGALLSRSIYDVSGNLSSKAVVDAKGLVTVTVYDTAGKSYPYVATTYDADHDRIRESSADATGKLTVKLFEPGAHDAYQVSSYHVDGSLASVIKHIDGQHIGETYQNGVIAKIEIYNAAWKLISRDSFDASGKLTQRQVDNADGTHDVSTFNAKTGLIQSTTEYSSSWKTVGVTKYDAAGVRTQHLSYEADGSRVIDFYKAGGNTLSRTEHLTTDGKVASVTTYSDKGYATNIFAPPGSSKLQSTLVVENDVLVSKTSYDAQGRISDIRIDYENGRHEVQTFKPGQQDHAASTSLYDASWKLVSVTSFDAQGQKTSINVAGDKGLNTVTSFVAGTDKVSAVDVFINWKLQSRTNYDADGKISKIQLDRADGTHEVQTFKPGQQDHASSTSLYDASWKLVSVTSFDTHGQKTSINVAGDKGLNTVTSFVAGTDKISAVDVFVNWKLQSRTNYDADGKISKIQLDRADGTHEVQTFKAGQQDHAASTSLYDASWKLVSVTSFDAHGQKTSINVAGDKGLNTVTSFVAGTDKISAVDVFINWKLQSRTNYDADGKISKIQLDRADGTHEVQTFKPGQQDHPATTSVYDSSWKIISFKTFEPAVANFKMAAAHAPAGLDFLVADTSIDTLHIKAATATSETTVHTTGLDAFKVTGFDLEDNVASATSHGDVADVVFVDNHDFLLRHDASVIATHYDLM